MKTDYTKYIQIRDGENNLIPWEYNEFPDGQVQAKVRRDIFPENIEEHKEDEEGKYRVGSWRMYASIPNPVVLDLYNQLTLMVDLWAEHNILYCYGARCDKSETETYFVCPVAAVFLDNISKYSRWNREGVNVEKMKLLAPHCHKLINEEYVPTLKTDYSIPDSINLGDWDLVVFPDESAYERFGRSIGKMPYVVCEKHRNQDDGSIIEYILPELPNNVARVLLCDDLCDGGFTFITTYSALLERNPNLIVDLFIVHGVFSNNAVDRLLDKFNSIHVSNSLPNAEEQRGALIESKKDRIHIYDVWGRQ